ncbi:hypothetical protein [Streptomyces regalis]|uniref:Uncharacterized protein n=1 Tax=Streptomyces regalis TaxID=68262 RepID=A0A101JCK8_9ACTN|nr:hypothetical protein [Streptomyces regalis]KUL24293.1 hypothetical protein ADL12_37385 [Streptomyces regalis]
MALGLQIEEAGRHSDMALEATCGWYWAVDISQSADVEVHDFRDAADLSDLAYLLRSGLKAQVHAVLARPGDPHPRLGPAFGVDGRALLTQIALGGAGVQRVGLCCS